MPISAFANLKGGVGKTVITGGCAHAAAAQGKRVLLVDTDPQANTTKHFSEYNIDNRPNVSLADVLDRNTQTPIEEAIIATRRKGIDLLPSGFDELQAVQDALVGKPGAENSLGRVLRPIADQWDYVFIDTRPATDLITRNALMASDNVVIVLQPEPDALDGYAATLNAIEELNEYLGKDLPIAGWVVNLLDRRRGDHAEQLAWIQESSIKTGIPVLGEPVPALTDLSRLSVVGMGADEHPKSSARMRNIAENFRIIVESLDMSNRKAA